MRIKKFNCKPTLKKKITIPTRKDLLPILNELKPQIVNRVFTVEEIIELLGVFIGRRFNVDVTHATAHEVNPGDIDLNAYYDSGLDEAGDTSIELYLVTNHLDETMILNEKEFDSVAKRIMDSISHEMIHMKQHRARDFLELDDKLAFVYADNDQLESQLYLGTPDEIHAYAFNIAEELAECPDLKKRLETPSKVGIDESLNLWAYLHTFEKDVEHPVMKRLLKKIYKNLAQMHGKKLVK